MFWLINLDEIYTENEYLYCYIKNVYHCKIYTIKIYNTLLNSLPYKLSIMNIISEYHWKDKIIIVIAFNDQVSV